MMNPGQKLITKKLDELSLNITSLEKLLNQRLSRVEGALLGCLPKTVALDEHLHELNATWLKWRKVVEENTKQINTLLGKESE